MHAGQGYISFKYIFLNVLTPHRRKLAFTYNILKYQNENYGMKIT